MFTKSASFEELGFARDSDKDARYESIKRGGLLTPEARELVAFLREAQISE